MPDPCYLVGMIGRLWPQKRVKDAIWALDLLRVFRKDVYLVIVGDGPQRPQLERFRDLVTIEKSIYFLGHRSDVPRLLPHFDLFWSTSAYEGQPNSVMEAMAAAIPVVATDIPGTREPGRPWRDGLLDSHSRPVCPFAGRQRRRCPGPGQVHERSFERPGIGATDG